MEKTINILVDGDEPKVKGALPLPGMGEITQKVVEVGSDALKQSIRATLDGILEVISESSVETNTHVVTEIKFRVVFNATGEVSIVSLAKGSLSSGTGLEFTITKKGASE